MVGVNDDDTELNRFECPGLLAPVASADLAVYISWGKITYKDVILRRNVDGSHTDDGILEVLQLESHVVPSNCRIDIHCVLLPSS